MMKEMITEEWKMFFIGLIGTICIICLYGAGTLTWAGETCSPVSCNPVQTEIAEGTYASGNSGLSLTYTHGNSTSTGCANGSYNIHDPVYAEGQSNSFVHAGGAQEGEDPWSGLSINSEANRIAGENYNLSVKGSGQLRTQKEECLNAEGIQEFSTNHSTADVYFSDSANNEPCGSGVDHISGQAEGVGWSNVSRPDENTIMGETHSELSGSSTGNITLRGEGFSTSGRNLNSGTNFVGGSATGKFGFEEKNNAALAGTAKSQNMSLFNVEQGGMYGRSISRSMGQVGAPNTGSQ